MTKKHYEEIIKHCRDCFPKEACGLLGGEIKGNIKTVKKIYTLTNVDDSQEHFSMEPKEQFDSIRDMRKNGWKLLGNFHSHPFTPSRPSDEDKKLAYDSSVSYLILSFEYKEEPVLKSFRIFGGNVEEESIEYIDGG